MAVNLVYFTGAFQLPKTPETILAEGRALLTDGQNARAVAFLQAARRRSQEHPGIALLLADALHAAGRLPEAVAAYEAALRLDPDSADGWFSLGCAQLAWNAHGAAAESLVRAAALAPHSAPVRYNLGKSLFQLGAIEAAIENFEHAARDPALTRMALSSIATIIPGSPAADNAAVLQARRSWAEAEAALLPPMMAPRPAPLAGRKLRIGYLSAFLGDRNWIKPVMAMVNHHDRSRVEIHFFSDGKPPSAASGYRDHDHDYVHDFVSVENDRAAEIIQQIGIDVLVDLNGYSVSKRLPLLMRRPAPRILGWFNLFATTGIAAFDWLVGDDAVLPAAEEQFYTEKIHRLPGSYIAFEILYPVPEVTPPPCLAAGSITFGCLGSHYKLTAGVLAAFGRILAAAPGAKLFIKNGALEDASTRADFLRRLQTAGIDAARVTLAGRSEHFAFLEAYAQVDIALDTFPYNGGTTTTEALWQGVPVLSFDGDRWVSRTSKSLLLAAGLDDWLMPDQAAYEARAIALANNPEAPAMLASLRAGMRAKLSASAVCDTAGLCRAMERFYAEISAGPE
jgi:predicted O-linked N-acetylglucosamine transferase (SPINDLY family)